MSEHDILLDVSDVAAVYNHSIRALNGVSFQVRAGEIFALVGANGAGKTTLLKAVSNLLSAERGRLTGGAIRFAGRSVFERNPADLVRDGLAQVLEGRHCFRSLTVEENLVTGGLGRSLRRHDVAAGIDLVYHLFPRLKERRHSLAGLISGGEQQMTAIGRALVSRPKLLVLDEPSMGLAPLVVRDIFEALARLNREEGLTILLAEQNSRIALNYADRAAVLENGTTVLTASAGELSRNDALAAFYLGGSTQSAAASTLN